MMTSCWNLMRYFQTFSPYHALLALTLNMLCNTVNLFLRERTLYVGTYQYVKYNREVISRVYVFLSLLIEESSSGFNNLATNIIVQPMQ